jgi:hypothetical protein
MAEISYNFSSLYIVLAAILYKILILDFTYFQPVFNNIFQFNGTSIFFVINVIALGILLTRLRLTVYIKFSLE